MINLNILRTWYNKLPLSKKKYLSMLLSLVPISYRYGKKYEEYLFNIKRSKKDFTYVREYQQSKLKYIINIAFEKSVYYSRLFKDTFGNNFNPEKFELKELVNIPILTKEIIRNNLEQLLVKDKKYLDLVSTSGSSGVPLSFYLDRDRSVKEWAFVNYAWSKIGYKPKHKRAVLRGLDFSKCNNKYWHYDYALKELLLSPFNLKPDVMNLYFELMKKYKIDFIHGYPSAIEILARYALKMKITPPPSLKGILPISEHLTEEVRGIINIAFGNPKIMPFYGMSEKVAFASEILGEPDTYEFEPLYGYTELIDENGTVINEPGKLGKIISTGFISFGMPLIRYDTEDTAILVESPSKENCYHLKLKNIRSRWNNEYLVTKNNSLISMSALNIHSKGYLNVREFQIYQDKPGFAVIKVVPYESTDIELLNKLKDEFQSKTLNELDFELIVVDQLNMNERGKRRFIDQKLDIWKIKNEQYNS